MIQNIYNELKKELGISTLELSENIGVSMIELSEYFNNKKELPNSIRNKIIIFFAQKVHDM